MVDDMVILVIITAGVVYSYTVTVGYLKTEKGKLLLDNAKKVIYDGTTYLKDKFSKIISGIGEQVKKGVEAFDKACKELIDLFSGASKKSDAKKKNGSNGKGQTGKEKAETGHKIGENGTRTSSDTMAQKGKTERIDVENPNPGQRDGQIHYHDPKNKKYKKIWLHWAAALS